MVRRLPLVFVFAMFAAWGSLAQAAKAPKDIRKSAPNDAARICESVQAIATGFGEENATRFAQGNLDLLIDQTKDRLAGKGAKGFSVAERLVKCADYIDFGGSIGREHKCRASAKICGKVT